VSSEAWNIFVATQPKSVRYTAAYVPIVGSVNGALLLSQICYLAANMEDGDGTILEKVYRTDEKLRQELGFSERELKTAKALVKEVDFVTVSREGAPAKTYYELDVDAWLETMKAAGAAMSGGARKGQSDGPKEPNRLDQTGQSVGTKEPNKMGRKSPTSSDERAQLLYKNKNKNTKSGLRPQGGFLKNEGLGMVPSKADASTLSKFDTTAANKLLEAVALRLEEGSILLRKNTAQKWGDAIRLLREHGGYSEDEIKKVVQWFCKHIEDKYVPHAFTPEKFRHKFMDIAERMETWSPPPLRAEEVTVDPDNKDVQSVIREYSDIIWPDGCGHEFPAFVQRLYDKAAPTYEKVAAVTKLYKPHARPAPNLDPKEPLEDDDAAMHANKMYHACVGFYNQLGSMRHYLKTQVESTAKRITRWEGWRGSLLNEVPDLEGEDWQRRIRAARDRGMWDLIMAKAEELLKETK
jgi:hypothetical protein